MQSDFLDINVIYLSYALYYTHTISNNGTQNIRHISRLDSATGKYFNTYFWSSPTTRPKREPFLQIGLQERGYSNLGCLSLYPKWVSCIRTLLEGDTVLSETHFTFRCPYGSLVGDSLRTCMPSFLIALWVDPKPRRVPYGLQTLVGQ